ADPEQVVCGQQKARYAAPGPVRTPQPARLGRARMARPGADVTLVSYGATVATCLDAAATLEDGGIQAEVLDLRSIQPWDKAAVLASMSRTHRAVIVHEAVQAFGVGAEIAATLAHDGFDELDAPVVRVAAPFMPATIASSLEAGSAVT